MSRGKIDAKDGTGSLIDRLNYWLARLMGKKDGPKPFNSPEVPNNLRFIVIVIAMLAMLWGLTGVYYIPTRAYGLIIQNGKITQVESGVKVGLTYPYPVAAVSILDGSVATTSLGKGQDDNVFSVSTGDQHNLAITAEFSYYISNPQVYFLNYYQEDSDLDQRLTWMIKAIIQDYCLQKTSQGLLQGSLIVTSNEIRELSQTVLANYGISLQKLAITKITNLTKQPLNVVLSQNSTAATQPAQQILQEAKQYTQQQQQASLAFKNEFMQLLPQYRENKKAIAELIYYKMLSQLPESSAKVEYRYLNLSESEFLAGVANPQRLLTPAELNASNDLRAVDRSVNRVRRFKDR